MTFKETAQTYAMEAAFSYIAKNPKESLPKLLSVLETVDVKGTFKPMIEQFRVVVKDPSNNWNRFIINLFQETDTEVLKAIFRNFALNASFIGFPKQEAKAAELGCNIPWAMLIDPTSACNLSCTGCWAAEYGNKLNLSFEELDDIICQGKDLGTHLYLFSGGEPLVRKSDIIALCRKHSDCQFMAFTNGTLIDDAFAAAMLEVKNFIPAISVEGFEGDTDFRRGKGTFEAVNRAMDILNDYRLPFGLSLCYTSKNTQVIGSEEYFDWMVERGARFAWFFTYMPVGNDAAPELMVSAEQRAFMYEQVRRFRETKPLFTMDFWNDGEYAGGCVAGGRKYLHINANGDIEPCAFIHYSDSNIGEKTILEALRSPLFMGEHDNQPFNDNHLRPCPLLDNPDALAELVESSGAHSTDLHNPENVQSLCAKCTKASSDWAAKADELWVSSHSTLATAAILQ